MIRNEYDANRHLSATRGLSRTRWRTRRNAINWSFVGTASTVGFLAVIALAVSL